MKKNLSFILLFGLCTFAFFSFDQKADISLHFYGQELFLPLWKFLMLFLALLVLLLLAVDLLFVLFRKLSCSVHLQSLENNDFKTIQKKDAEEAMLLVLKVMTSTAEGDLKQGRQNLTKLKSKIGNHDIADLLELRILKKEKDFDKLEKLSQKLLKSKNSQLVGIKALTESWSMKNDFEKALPLANKAFEARQDLFWVVKYAFDLRAKSADWQGALEVLETASKKNLINKEKYAELKAICLYEIALEEKKKGQKLSCVKNLIQAHDLLPDFVPAALELADFYQKDEQIRKAQKLLKEVWRINPNVMIAEAYLKLFDDDTPLSHVQRMENLALCQAKNQALNNFMLADLNMKAKLWDKAKSEFELFLISNPATKKIAKLISKYEKVVNQNIKAAQNWSKREKDCVEDCLWVCSHCAKTSSKWKPFCPDCGAFNSLNWHLYFKKNK